MDNFKVIYKILSTLEKAMDYPEFDINLISAEKLGISQERWCRYIEMMADTGYIKGVEMYMDITGELNVEAKEMRITLKGLEYLQENTIMQRMYQMAKGITNIG